MLVVRFEPILSFHKAPVKLDNTFSLKRCFAGGMLFEYRGVAQPGSAPAWGAGGRWFKSTRPDIQLPHSLLIRYDPVSVATLTPIELLDSVRTEVTLGLEILNG